MEIKKFIIRATCITALVFCLSLILHFAIYPTLHLTPWSWGSEVIDQKKIRLQQTGSLYNNVIIGSSRVYRQIDPVLLDSLMGNESGIKSFNFGTNWLFAPESFYVYDHVVQQEQPKMKYVIMELSKIRSTDYENLHTTRLKYWNTFNYFKFATAAIAGSNFAIHEKIAVFLGHFMSYIDKLINLGYVTEAFNFNANIYKYTSLPDLGPLKSGFVTLIAEPTFQNPDPEENAPQRNRKFLSDTSVVTKRKKISEKQFTRFEKNPELLNKYNKYYASYLNKMIDDAKSKGIYLIFIMSPRVDGNQYTEIIPLFYHIYPDHRIEMSDSRKYPELYLAANSFDETHLNEKGAKVYTGILADNLKKLLKYK